jgi:hypothetical protein
MPKGKKYPRNYTSLKVFGMVMVPDVLGKRAVKRLVGIGLMVKLRILPVMILGKRISRSS